MGRTAATIAVATTVAVLAAVLGAVLGAGDPPAGGDDEAAPQHAASRTAQAARPAPALAPSAMPGLAAQVRTRADRPFELDDLLRQSRLSESWLATHGFSSGDALRRLHALLDARTQLIGEPRARLAVRPSGASENSGEHTPRLAAEERYVLATLATPPNTGIDSVLVRWRRTSDNAVLELSAQALPAGAESLQLWLHTPENWPQGSYRLEVISATPGLEPLAVADFEIVGHDAPVTAFAYPVSANSQP
jgi:hypothetical protein